MKRIKDRTMKQCQNRTAGRIFRIALFFLLPGAGLLSGTSYYYRQTFDSLAAAQAAGWTNFGTAGVNTHNISRDGLFFPTETSPWGGYDYNDPGVSTVSNFSGSGELYLYGRPNNGDLAYNNIWTGKAVQFIPRNAPEFSDNLSASAENPIGFMIVRTHAHVDANNELQGEYDYHQSAINVWLVQEDPSVTEEWDNYANFVYFMELSKMIWDSPDDVSRLGFFDGAEHFPAAASGPDNSTYSGYSSSTWRINYDNGDTSESNHNEVGYGTAINQNNQPLAIRITHDGSRVRYYLNGNPYDGDGILDAEPNTFHYFGESSVSWNSDMKIMVGHETLYFFNESQSARYHDFVIRSVCDTVTSSITPQQVLAGTTCSFLVSVTPTINASDSGIGEIIIRKPSWITNDWDLSSVVLTNAITGSQTGRTRLTNGYPIFSDQFRVMTNRTGDLKVLLRTDDFMPGVIESTTGDKRIFIGFQLGMPSTASGTGDDFSVFVNLEKYPAFTYNISDLPTTGKKKATPASPGSMRVRSFQQPAACASVTASPSVINEGGVSDVNASIVYEISTRGVTDKPAVCTAMIVVPDGFSISNVQSLLITDDASNIELTSSNTIVLKYSDDAAGELPSPDGYDRITFNVYGTPSLPEGVSNQQYAFSSKVDSSAFVQGSSYQDTTTNASYPSQMVRVAAEDPAVSCHIFPTTLGNATRTNDMVYTVLNNGNTYNKVALLRIYVDPAKVSSIDSWSSSRGGSISYVAPYLTVDYTAVGLLGSGESDSISFRIVHNITNISSPVSYAGFTSEADNNNGKGYLACSQGSTGWQVAFQPPEPGGEAYATPGEIWTSDCSTVFSVNIYNNGPKGDHLYQALIAIPSIFTNASEATVSSSLIASQTWIVRTNRNGTNYIWLRYNKAGTNIVSRNEQEGLTPKDTVQMTLVDNVVSTTNSYTFDVFVDNTTNDSFPSSFTATNQATVFSTNSLTFQLLFPPLKASFDVQSRFTNTYGALPVNEYHRMDASTATNTLVVRVENEGMYGNFIRRLYIYFPSDVITNVVAGSFSSSLLGASGMTFVPASGSQDAFLLVNYQAEGTNLSAGIQDEIALRVIDHVSDNRYARIVVHAVNDRENAQLTNILSGAGNSDSIEYFIPPARGSASVLPRVFYVTPDGAETNTVVIAVSNCGGGSNDLTKVNVLFPSLFHGNVLSASNTHTGVDQDDPAMTLGSTNLTLNYSSTLNPGQVDYIYLQVKVNSTVLGSEQWQVHVDNAGTVGNEVTVIPGGSLCQYSTQPPYLNVYESGVNDHDVYTSNVTNVIRMRFINGTNLSCQSNLRYRITVPQPFEMPYVSVSNLKPATISCEGRDIIITYASPLTGYNFDEVSIQVTDSFEEQETNTVWTAQVDYGDGVWKDVASNGLIDSISYTNMLSIILPPATAGVYLEPAFLDVAATSQVYSIVIENTGIPGNHIRMIEVTPPVFITNVDTVAGSGNPLTSLFTNGKLYLQYSGTRLLAGEQDTITFTGYDTVDTSTGVPVNWSVKVANTADTNHLYAASIAEGRTLSTLVVCSEYRGEFSVTPNTVDTSVESNTFTMYIENKSPQSGLLDSCIQYAKILFPTNVLLTNNMQVTSSRASAVYLSNDCILLQYATPLAPKSSDMVLITAVDSFSSGATNAFWDVLLNFNTLGSSFTNAELITGGTNLLAFVMPAPVVSAALYQREGYTTSTNISLIYVLSNAGSGSNEVERVWLDLPADLASSVTRLSNLLGGTVQYSGGRISVDYSNFTPGTVDRLYFTAARSASGITNYTLTMMASNVTVGSSATATSVLGDVLSFVTPPTVRVAPNDLWTTESSTNISLYLSANGSGSSPIRTVRVRVPEIFTAVSAISSSRLGTITPGGGNSIEIDYSGDPLLQGQDDVISFTLSDDFTHGYSNVEWLCEVDNGSGYAAAARYSAIALSNRFVMPVVSALGSLKTTWIYASDTASSYVTNTIELDITNTGSGSNNLYRFKLVFPEEMTNVSAMVSSKGGIVELLQQTNLIVYYTNDLLTPGQSDRISFQLIHNVDSELTFTYGFYADNDDGNGLVRIGAPGDPGSRQLSVYLREELPEMYIKGAKACYIQNTITNRTIYTMDDAAVISIMVKNKSRRFRVDQLTIGLTNMFTVTAITSSLAGNLATAAYDHQTNLLFIDYTGTGTNIGIGQADLIDIYVSYDKAAATDWVTANHPITNIADGQFRYAGTAGFQPGESLNKNDLVLGNAPFGRFYGVVLPGSSGATVTLKYPGSATLATNIDGSTFNAPIDSTSGAYVLDRIPPSSGPYSIVVLPASGELQTNDNVLISPVNYQSVTISNVTAVQNTATLISNIYLKYSRLSDQAPGRQEICSPEDPLTRLLVPAGTLFAGVTVNIGLGTMNLDQQTSAAAAELNNAPTDASTLRVFTFTMSDLHDLSVSEHGFKGDLEISLHYEPTNISSQGWNESDLAIYYWKDSTKEWVLVGGLVDSGGDTVTAKVSYLHAVYTVMSRSAQSSKAIRSVQASPNPFTPGRGASACSTMKLTFSFNKPYSGYTVKIYNLRGRLIRTIKGSGEYAQGEVFWDGKAESGFYVRGGVYLYQIYAGTHVFTGSVLLLK